MMRDDVDVAGPPAGLESDGLSLRRTLRPRGPVQLAVSRRVVTGATIVEVAGELDVLTAGKLGSELDQIVRRQAGDLVVDLRHTGFVDSAGLQLLLSSQRRLSRQERGLAVVCGPGQVRRVIERARLLEALGVVASLGELPGTGPNVVDPLGVKNTTSLGSGSRTPTSSDPNGRRSKPSGLRDAPQAPR